MLEELAKGFWKNGKCSRAALSSPYRARLQDETPLSAKNARMEELISEKPPMSFNHKVPSWKEENLFARGHQFGGRWPTKCFLGWGGEGCRLQGSVSSVHSQQWSSSMFARSLATLKGKLDRRKRDLARREFQLLRRKTKLLKATLSPEERLLWRLRKANRKKSLLLHQLKKYELEEDPEPVHDPELITAEQLQALKKIGYKNRNYVPVGRRGVYGGVVQNMHMHWKFHETVQVDCHIFKREDIRSIARQLAVLSGGIVIDIHQATNIIMYRGRNYKQPKKQMIPPNTLNKRKALFKSKHLQALESLETLIRNVEGELHVVRAKQKEGAAQGTENDNSKLRQVGGKQTEEDTFSANLDEMSSEDFEGENDIDGLFNWDSDSLDEDELSDDDEVIHKESKVVHKEKVMEPVSWSSADLAKGSKKKRLTAKELILAEQELFRNRRQADVAQKHGPLSVQRDKPSINKNGSMDKSLKTDVEDNNAEKDDGVTDKKSRGLHASEDNAELLDIACRAKGHEQIKNKKIAKFMEDFISDSDVKEELGSDFDDLDSQDAIADVESWPAKQSDNKE